MGMFGNILAKLGFGRDKVDAADREAAATHRDGPEIPAFGQDQARAGGPGAGGASGYQPPPPDDVLDATGRIDVFARLSDMAATRKESLNWRESIVDLLKLLDLDSSYEARKRLATELGCPSDAMGDSARMNRWLHETVMQKVEDNGGNLPPELLRKP